MIHIDNINLLAINDTEIAKIYIMLTEIKEQL